MDYLYRVDRILEDGETMVKESLVSPGGSAANTICGLARLGVKTGFIGVVGDDNDGQSLLKDLERFGVDVSLVRTKPDARTGSVICLSDSLGRRSLYVLPGANSQLTMDDLDLDYIASAKMLHLSSFADDRQLEVSVKLIDKLRPPLKLSFSPGMLYARKGIAALTPIFARTSVLFINQAEIEQMTGEDVSTGAETCMRLGCRVVAVTLGKGREIRLGKSLGDKMINAVAYIRNARREFVIQPPGQSPAVVETTGAGDAFAAGFLYGLLNDKSSETCGQLGNVTAQFSLARPGARDGLPTLDQLSTRYHELYGKAL
jgi:ribokinase